MSRLTPRLALLEPQILTLDLSGSLHLFGGARALWRRVLQASPMGTQAGMAPSSWGAALLARGPQARRRTLQAKSMQRNLDQLPCQVLTLTPTQATLVHDWGCGILGQLRRLPRPGLAQRGFTPILEQLDRAYQPTRAPAAWLTSPLSFRASRELAFHGTSLAALDTALVPLMTDLCRYLQEHQVAITQMSLTLHHDATRVAEPETRLVITLSQPQWEAAACLHLCHLRLQALGLPGPVLSLTLNCPHCPPRQPLPTSLLPDTQLDQQKNDRLLDVLQARLGAACLAHPNLQDWPLPEQAESWVHSTSPLRHPASTLTQWHGPESRPFWLLPHPLALITHQERPFWQGQPLQLQARPERIEGGWWRLNNIRRDYFVAQDTRSVRYWVYHDLKTGGWFLHGLFA